MLDPTKTLPSPLCAGAFLLGLLLATACSEPGHQPGKNLDPSLPDSPEWTSIKARIRKTFPTVTEISTEELARELATPQSGPEKSVTPKPILLDARPEAEYRVSHLQGARRFEPSLLSELAKDSPIVVYCGVGYRSAELAQRLEKLGFSRVRNLEGSIFEWVNEGRPVYSGSSRVHKVHPYDREWGLLLDPTYH